MTEPSKANQGEGNWGDVGTPTDLWRAGKALTFADPDEAAQAWRKTVRTLEGLCQVADALMLEPLQLALVDALARSGEELERALDHEERPEGVQLTARQDERLKALMRRSDALTSASVAVEEWRSSPAAKERTLEVLREMRDEASRNFEVYGREVGLPKPGKPAT
jgi:hypothetical protein